MINYPWSKPIISDLDSLAVENAVRSTWISGGAEIVKLTENLNHFLDSSNVLLVNNGTSALAACFQAINIQPGDEVVVPAFGFMAAANILLQMKVNIVFSDVNKNTWCVDEDSLDACISPKTRAIVATHTYGNSGNLDAIVGLCREQWKVPLIEDAAEALGSKSDGRALGTFGDFGTFSFHATKLITTGEGGAINCKNDEVNDKLKLIISHGLNRSNHYLHELPGSNFRMPNFCAALGNSQFSRIDFFIAERKRIDSIYRHRISVMKHSNRIEFQSLRSAEIVPWSFPIRLETLDLEKQIMVASLLLGKGIEIRPGFRTPKLLPYLKSKVDPSKFPISNSLAETILSLPAYPSLSERDIDYICDKLDEVISEIGLN